MRRSPAAALPNPPQKKDAVHRELRPGKGMGANANEGPLRRATRPAAGRARPCPRRHPPRRRSPTRHVPRASLKPDESEG